MTRILVVDDIENNIKTLSFDLLDDNYEVTTALSGHQVCWKSTTIRPT